MSADTADAEIDSVVDELDAANAPAVDSAVHGEVAAHDTTPCSADEARELIATAITAANTFQESISALLSRKAHVALGYPTPGEMILRELSGTFVNPRTNKPVTSTHLRRMARVAMLLWHVADRTGVDPGELEVSESAVRGVAVAEAGVGDQDLVNVIATRIQQLNATQPDEISKIIHDTATNYTATKAAVEEQAALEANTAPAAADTTTSTPAVDGGFDDTLDDEDDEFDAAGTMNDSRPKGTNLAASAGGTSDDISPPSSSTPPNAHPEAPNSAPPAPPPLPPADSVTSVFDTEIPDDIALDVDDFDVSKVLEHMRTATDVRRVLHDIARICELLPPIIEIRDKVPQIIDAIDDPELDSLQTELGKTDGAIELAEAARAVIATALSEVQYRYDEAV